MSSMIHETFNFTPDGRVNLTSYVLPKEVNGKPVAKRPAIIVMPGGAFMWLSEAEGEPVALTFLREGFSTFVLHIFQNGWHGMSVSNSLWTRPAK